MHASSMCSWGGGSSSLYCRPDTGCKFNAGCYFAHVPARDYKRPPPRLGPPRHDPSPRGANATGANVPATIANGILCGTSGRRGRGRSRSRSSSRGRGRRRRHSRGSSGGRSRSSSSRAHTEALAGDALQEAAPVSGQGRGSLQAQEPGSGGRGPAWAAQAQVPTAGAEPAAAPAGTQMGPAPAAFEAVFSAVAALRQKIEAGKAAREGRQVEQHPLEGREAVPDGAAPP